MIFPSSESIIETLKEIRFPEGYFKGLEKIVSELGKIKRSSFQYDAVYGTVSVEGGTNNVSDRGSCFADSQRQLQLGPITWKYFSVGRQSAIALERKGLSLLTKEWAIYFGELQFHWWRKHQRSTVKCLWFPAGNIDGSHGKMWFRSDLSLWENCRDVQFGDGNGSRFTQRFVDGSGGMQPLQRPLFALTANISILQRVFETIFGWRSSSATMFYWLKCDEW